MTVRFVVQYDGPVGSLATPPTLNVGLRYLNLVTLALEDTLTREFPQGVINAPQLTFGFPLTTVTYEGTFLVEPVNIVHNIQVVCNYQYATVISGLVEINQVSGGSVTSQLPMQILLVSGPPPDIQYSITGGISY